jgi:integrase
MRKVMTLETNERFDLVQNYAQVDLELNADKYRFECIAFLLALDTGLRASDLLNLKITDITFNSDLRRYECRSDIKKTGVKNHLTLISRKTFEAVKTLDHRITYIFTNPNTNQRFTRFWLYKRAKLRYGFTFHTLRKISAKRILDVGTLADAQRHLAHKRISSTDKYLGVSEKDSLDRLSVLYKD